MKSVYRVHTVINHPPGSTIYESAKRQGGEYWKDHDINSTKWDIVIAPDVETACAAVRKHHEAEGSVIKRIYSLNHFGDVTIDATEIK